MDNQHLLTEHTKQQEMLQERRRIKSTKHDTSILPSVAMAYVLEPIYINTSNVAFDVAQSWFGAQTSTVLGTAIATGILKGSTLAITGTISLICVTSLVITYYLYRKLNRNYSNYYECVDALNEYMVYIFRISYSLENADKARKFYGFSGFDNSNDVHDRISELMMHFNRLMTSEDFSEIEKSYMKKRSMSNLFGNLRFTLVNTGKTLRIDKDAWLSKFNILMSKLTSALTLYMQEHITMLQVHQSASTLECNRLYSEVMSKSLSFQNMSIAIIFQPLITFREGFLSCMLSGSSKNCSLIINSSEARSGVKDILAIEQTVASKTLNEKYKLAMIKIKESIKKIDQSADKDVICSVTLFTKEFIDLLKSVYQAIITAVDIDIDAELDNPVKMNTDNVVEFTSICNSLYYLLSCNKQPNFPRDYLFNTQLIHEIQTELNNQNTALVERIRKGKSLLPLVPAILNIIKDDSTISAGDVLRVDGAGNEVVVGMDDSESSLLAPSLAESGILKASSPVEKSELAQQLEEMAENSTTLPMHSNQAHLVRELPLRGKLLSGVLQQRATYQELNMHINNMFSKAAQHFKCDESNINPLFKLACNNVTRTTAALQAPPKNLIEYVKVWNNGTIIRCSMLYNELGEISDEYRIILYKLILVLKIFDVIFRDLYHTDDKNSDTKISFFNLISTVIKEHSKGDEEINIGKYLSNGFIKSTYQELEGTRSKSANSTIIDKLIKTVPLFDASDYRPFANTNVVSSGASESRDTLNMCEWLFLIANNTLIFINKLLYKSQAVLNSSRIQKCIHAVFYGNSIESYSPSKIIEEALPKYANMTSSLNDLNRFMETGELPPRIPIDAGYDRQAENRELRSLFASIYSKKGGMKLKTTRRVKARAYKTRHQRYHNSDVSSYKQKRGSSTATRRN